MHPRALERPLEVGRAWEVVREWLSRPNVRVPVPTDRENHTSDAHLAALAIEWGLELCSADRDFARYPGLRWRDPLAEPEPS